MPRYVLVDEFQLAIRAPRGLEDESVEAIRATIDDAVFQAKLRRAITAVVKEYPALGVVKVKLSR
jgi:hypothetical protein